LPDDVALKPLPADCCFFTFDFEAAWHVVRGACAFTVTARRQTPLPQQGVQHAGPSPLFMTTDKGGTLPCLLADAGLRSDAALPPARHHAAQDMTPREAWRRGAGGVFSTQALPRGTDRQQLGRCFFELCRVSCKDAAGAVLHCHACLIWMQARARQRKPITLWFALVAAQYRGLSLSYLCFASKTVVRLQLHRASSL